MLLGLAIERSSIFAVALMLSILLITVMSTEVSWAIFERYLDKVAVHSYDLRDPSIMGYGVLKWKSE